MKRISVVLLLMFAFLLPTIGQELDPLFSERVLPKDSLPNLWIVTVDMSGSMVKVPTENAYLHVYSRVDSILRLNGMIAIDENKDRMIVMKSGMDKTVLLSSVSPELPYFGANHIPYHYKKIDFSSTFIKKAIGPVSFRKAMNYIKNECGDRSKYEFGLSYTSLIRPLSIFELTKDRRSNDFAGFRNIYHVLVTDGGDVNDQWLEDYKYLKKYTRVHFDTICKILPTRACSNFDFSSKKSGKFDEIVSYEELTHYTSEPQVYLSQYITYEDVNADMESLDSLMVVRDFHDKWFSLQMRLGSDCVKLVYVDSCQVNGHTVSVKQYLYPDDIFVVKFDSTFVNHVPNKVYAAGSYQEQYQDRILGQRYRKVDYYGEFADGFVSVETKVARQQCQKTIIWSIVGTLLAILVFVIFWRNIEVLIIFVNGKRWSIKRKAMNRLKNDDFTLVTVVCNDYRMTEALFYKGNGISVEDDDSTERWGNLIIIRPRFREITPNCPKFELCPRNEKGNKKKNIVIGFDLDNIGDIIQFSYSDSLSHNLVIVVEKEEMDKARADDGGENESKNELRDCNLDMLARYYEESADRIGSVRNNVQINIIRKGSLAEKFASDYAALNIFDLNCRNRANHIFLRYSIICSFDARKSDEEVAKQLHEIARRHVLKREGEKVGFVEANAYTDLPQDNTGVVVDVSPMLTYLYLLKKDKHRLLYSPFKDGQPPRTDGHPGIDSKTVKLFPKASMMLLNMPIKHKHPAIKKDNDFTIRHINSIPRKTEVLYLKGRDRVLFNNVEIDYACGAKIAGYILSWSLDDIITLINQE